MQNLPEDAETVHPTTSVYPIDDVYPTDNIYLPENINPSDSVYLAHVFDTARLVLSSVAVLAGISNILTLVVFYHSQEIRKKAINFLLVAMATVFLVYCTTCGTMEILDSSQVVRPTLLWCHLKIGLILFSNFTCCSLLIFINIFRLWVVLRRYIINSKISKRAAIAAICISICIGLGRFVYDKFENRVFHYNCALIHDTTVDSRIGDVAFLGICLVSLLSYGIQFLSLKYGCPLWPSNAVVPANIGSNVTSHGASVSAKVGMSLTLVYLASFLTPALPFIFGYVSPDSSLIQYRNLLRAFPYIQGFMCPTILAAGMSEYRKTLIKIGRDLLVKVNNCIHRPTGDLPLEIDI